MTDKFDVRYAKCAKLFKRKSIGIFTTLTHTANAVHRFDYLRPLSDHFGQHILQQPPQYPFFTAHNDRSTVLMFVASVIRDGNDSVRPIGWGLTWNEWHGYSGCFESPSGPEGYNRGVLLGATQALKLVYSWKKIGVHKIILASDSSYLVSGACRRLESWKWDFTLKNRNNHQDHVQNEHWRTFLALVRDLEHQGVDIQFCEINDRENQARDLASAGVIINGHFSNIYGPGMLLGYGDESFFLQDRLAINNVPTILAQETGPSEACAAMARVRIPIRGHHSAASMDEKIRPPLDAVRLTDALTAVITARIWND